MVMQLLNHKQKLTEKLAYEYMPAGKYYKKILKTGTLTPSGELDL